MPTKFKSFSSAYSSSGTWSSYAEDKLNEWLKNNPKVVIKDWKVCATGTSQVLTIVVEYWVIEDEKGE